MYDIIIGRVDELCQLLTAIPANPPLKIPTPTSINCFLW